MPRARKGARGKDGYVLSHSDPEREQRSASPKPHSMVGCLRLRQAATVSAGRTASPDHLSLVIVR